MCISKQIKWIKKKHCDFFFFHIFSIQSSSRHEKRCRMLQTLFWLFQCSRNTRWLVSYIYLQIDTLLSSLLSISLTVSAKSNDLTQISLKNFNTCTFTVAPASIIDGGSSRHGHHLQGSGLRTNETDYDDLVKPCLDDLVANLIHHKQEPMNWRTVTRTLLNM